MLCTQSLNTYVLKREESEESKENDLVLVYELKKGKKGRNSRSWDERWSILRSHAVLLRAETL